MSRSDTGDKHTTPLYGDHGQQTRRRDKAPKEIWFQHKPNSSFERLVCDRSLFYIWQQATQRKDEHYIKINDFRIEVKMDDDVREIQKEKLRKSA
jgi:hypothetical protein